MTYWDDVARHRTVAGNWMAHPLVRAMINRRVSGDANVWPVTAIRAQVPELLPLASVASIGCGIGGLERSLVEERIALDITGVDVSEPALSDARRFAAERGMTQIRYMNADARAFLRERAGTLDGVFFHQSLHHFDELDELMALVDGALKPGGMLWLDEYVGPSRDGWHWWMMAPANLAYRSLPRSLRRARLVRPPINREDPTEAIRSGDIVPAVSRRFRITHRRDYGGNLLAVVYPNLQVGEGFDEAVAKLIAMEERLLRWQPSYCSVIVARKR